MEIREEEVVRYKPGSEGLLAPLNPWLSDEGISEILINRPGEIFIEKGGVMTRTLVPELTAHHLKRTFTMIANENRQRLDEKYPILSGNLYDGSRVQLVIPPASTEYTLSIRKQSIREMTLEDYDNASFFKHTRAFSLDEAHNSSEDEEERELLDLYRQNQWWQFIAKAIERKKNIVISGETSSGKSSFLNNCMEKIPAYERLITLEDTIEIKPKHINCVRLKAPKKLKEEDPGVSMKDLVQCSLRLRPDRILMGEIRGAEILDFVGACATGHDGSLTTIHASNPRIAFMRMTQLYKLNNVPSMRDEDIFNELSAVIDVIIQLRRESRGRFAPFIYYKNADAQKSALGSCYDR